MWLLLGLVAALCWAIEEVYLKLGNDEGEDAPSQYKSAVCLGVFMGLAGLLMLPFSESETFIELIVNNKEFLIVPTVFAITTAISFIGYRYLDMSIQVSVEGASSPLALIILVIWYLAIGHFDSIWEEFDIIDMAAAGLIIVCVVILTVVQQLSHTGKLYLPSKKKKYAWWVMIFPIIYLFGDAFDTVICGVILNKDLGGELSSVDYNILYSLMFVVIGAFCWLRMYFKEGVAYNPFKKSEHPKMVGTALETVGQICSVFSMELTPVFSTVVFSAYPILSVFLSYIVLKERMVPVQWVCITCILLSLVVLGVSEAMGIMAG